MPDEDESDELDELTDDVSRPPNENADPQEIVNAKVPQALRDKYEIHSYRSAAVILAESHKAEFAEIVKALPDFSITTTMIRTAGGKESDIPPSDCSTAESIRSFNGGLPRTKSEQQRLERQCPAQTKKPA